MADTGARLSALMACLGGQLDPQRVRVGLDLSPAAGGQQIEITGARTWVAWYQISMS